MPEHNYLGRRKITLSLTKDEITPEKIINALPEVLRIHDKNAKEITYLYDYYKGKQPILNKTKIVRPEINNKVLENHAFEIVEFKKSYSYGEPIQYVQKGEKENQNVNPNISELNKYMESEDKSSLDKEIAEWQYICGTAYRWIDTDIKEDNDEAPFELRVPDPRQTFVVYSSGIREEVLFTGHFSYFTEKTMGNDESEYISKYRIITIYTDEYMLKIKEKTGFCELLNFTCNIDGNTEELKEYPLIYVGQRIIEYPLNKARLGLIELVMSILNAINQIKSDDLDGIDQFVQSLLVFVNQEVNPDDLKELLALGAIEVTSSDPQKPADLKLLVNQLKHSETKVVTDDLYGSLLNIIGMPRMNSKSSGGDTGQARLLGDGWTMADERAKQDELSFKKSERIMLKTVLSICQGLGKLEGLKLSDIDVKFTRNKSDNLLIKTEGLQTMKNAQVPPDVAFAICGLFSDPNEVYQKSKDYYGENLWKEAEKINETLTDEGKESDAQKKEENEDAR